MVTGISSKPPARDWQAPGRPERGFTLIEVLVVVVIVGIISAVVLLSTGLVADDRGLRQEARRMASLIELATDEAVLQGRDLGLEIMQGGYRFVEYDPFRGRWHELSGDDLLRPRDLEEGLRMELWIEDRRVELHEQPRDTGSDDEEDEDEAELIRGLEPERNRREEFSPHALIMSSGQLTPFDLQIIRDRDRSEIAVTVDPAGNIEVGNSDDDS